jgi:hypothetical protein
MTYRHIPLLNPIHKMSMLNPYELMLLVLFYHHGILFTEQGIGEEIHFISLQSLQCICQQPRRNKRSEHILQYNQKWSYSSTKSADNSNIYVLHTLNN